MVRLLPGASRALTAAALVLVAIAAVLPAGFALASGALVGSLRGAVRSGLGSPAGHRLLLAVLAVVVLFVLQQLAGPALRAVGDSLGRRLVARLQLRVMTATLAPVGVAHLEDPAVLDQVALAQGVASAWATPREAVVGLLSVASIRARGVASAVLLAGFRWWLALALLSFYVALVRILGDNFKRGVAAMRGHPQRFRRVDYVRDLALLPAAAKELRIFGLAGWVATRFEALWQAAMVDFWADRHRGRWVPPLSALGITVAQGGAFTLLALAAIHHQISIGRLTTFAGAVIGVASMRNFSMDNLNIGYGSAAVPAVEALERAANGCDQLTGGSRPADGLPAVGVRFEQVAFGYPGQASQVFQDLDLEITAGHSLAVVGANGAGKTTLVKLLARLHDPTAGRILVDDIALAEFDPRSWQRRVAAIFQDFVNYQLSAAENVGFGAIEHLGDREALVGAARAAGAAEIIEGLPSGWDTVLSRQFAGGCDLSGGEWQRVALARALLAVRAGAGILVLDEPTAALDVRAEAVLYDRFLEMTSGLTTVVISHRFSTVRRADRIVVLEGGRVVEDGNHDSLMAAGGRYATMFRLQAAHVTGEAAGA